jgi:hypothetical protein
VQSALSTAQNLFGYAVQSDQSVTLSRDAGLATTVVSVPVLAPWWPCSLRARLLDHAVEVRSPASAGSHPPSRSG